MAIAWVILGPVVLIAAKTAAELFLSAMAAHGIVALVHRQRG